MCCVVLCCGVVWCGVVWCGVVWCGVVWCGVVWCGVVWCGVVWCVISYQYHLNIILQGYKTHQRVTKQISKLVSLLYKLTVKCCIYV